jgi:MFS family permease
MRFYVDHLRSFTREARLFLLALIIFALATSVPTVFFNLYLQSLGFDRTFIGITTTAAQLGGAIASIPAALLLDVMGRRKAMIVGALGIIGGSAVSLVVTDAPLFIAIQAITGCASVLYALAVIPLLAEVSTPRKRTTLFSAAEGLTTLSLFAGSLIAGVLPMIVAPLLQAPPDSAPTYRAVMLGALLVRSLGILPLTLIHDSVHALPANTPRYRTVSYFHPRKLLKLQTPIWRFALPILITYLAGSLIFPFLSIFLKGRFGVSDVVLGVVIGAMNLSIGILTWMGPVVARALGRTRVVALGALFSAACLVLVGFGESFALVAIVVVLRAGLFNMTLPLYRAFVIDHSSPEEYAVVNLIYSTAANAGPTIAPAISGYAQDRVGFGPVFIAAIGLYTLAAGVFVWATQDKTPTVNRSADTVQEDM